MDKALGWGLGVQVRLIACWASSAPSTPSTRSGSPGGLRPHRPVASTAVHVGLRDVF